MTLSPLLAAIDQELKKGPLILALDGPCASGKTTLARHLAKFRPRTRVFHMDDFFLPPEKRTPQRLAEPGGNVDYERAEEELFLPLSQGQCVSFRPFDCSLGDFGPLESYAPARLSIVEGSYSHHPVLAGYSGLRVFLDCGRFTRLERLKQRESPESYQRFLTRWIPLEDKYFDAFHIRENAHLVLDGGQLIFTEEESQ